jgi:GTP-sensing pleiotropic transcriptional regulator CodY
MSAKLVDRVAILVAVRRFRGMGVVDSRSLRSGNYVRMQHFVDNFEVMKPRACIIAESGGLALQHTLPFAANTMAANV